MTRRQLGQVVSPPADGWWLKGRCRGVGPSPFYRDDSEPGYMSGAWRRFCMQCPVRADCLAVAYLGNERWGVWGGLTPHARRALAAQLESGSVRWAMVAAALSPQHSNIDGT